MIPILNQPQTRAGPAAPLPVRGVEAVGPVIANAQTVIPPVEEAAPTSEDVQLGRDGVYRTGQPEADIATRQPAKAVADDVEGPHDRAMFRAKVIKFLSALYGDDEAFLRALKLGTIVVRAVEDQPDPEMRPELTYAIYREGAAPAVAEMASRRGASAPVGRNDFVAWWPK